MSASIALTWRRAWNGDSDHTLIGDRSLASVLCLHGEAERIGLLHAVRSSSAEELVEAKLGYVYLGLPEVVLLIEAAQRMIHGSESAHGLDAEYSQLLADDKLFSSFATRYRLRPNDFSFVA